MPSAAKPTAVSRTAAGDHEIAVPSLGLSLTQRRLLTLLDRPIPAASLAERSGLPPEKFIRDLGRLARFRLVEGALPDDLAPGETAPDTVTRSAMTAPPAVTIRPAANAPSMADRGAKPSGRKRRGTVAAAVAGVAAAAAAAAFAWLHFAAEPGVREAAAPRQTPVAPAASRAASPAASPARVIATAKQASTATAPPPRVETTPADRAATAAAISALRRSEARSLGPVADKVSRTPQATPHEAKPSEAPRETAHSSTETPTDATVARPPTATASPAPSAAATIVAGPPHEAPAAPVPAPAATAATAVSAVSVAPPPAAATAVPSHAAASSAAPSQAAPSSVAPSHATAAPSHAAAAPATTPVTSPDASSDALVPIARVAPDFPAEAIRRRIDSGRVRARVTVDATGHVTAVAIVSASPRGVFDDAVSAALSRWRFPAGTAGRKALVDVDFHRD